MGTLAKHPVDSLHYKHAPTGPSGMSKKILVVDDDPAVLQVLKKYFSANGFGIITTDNGSEAVSAPRAGAPDIPMWTDDYTSVFAILDDTLVNRIGEFLGRLTRPATATAQ